MNTTSELAEKQRRVNEFLDRGGYDSLLLGRTDNFSWFTCGGSCYVNTAAETGVGALLIQRDRTTLITNNIEHSRLREEEVAGLGFQEDVSFWAEDDFLSAVNRLAPGRKIAADLAHPGLDECADEIAKLRRALTPEEVSRYRALGGDVGAALGEACLDLEPGMTEYEAAVAIAAHQLDRGINPIVILVAADDRLQKYRHPLPTMNEIKRTVMLVVCGRRQGLIVSATRLVHFGSLPEELQNKHLAVVYIDTVLNANTRIGARIGDIFEAGLKAYAEQGYPEEWKLHHQGGPTGYAARDYRALSTTDDLVETNQAFAWNPSITGTKSEDTIIATPEGPQIISASLGFPSIEVEAAGLTFTRAAILER